MQRLDVGFPSGEERCAAWLYVPDGDGRVPVVVLAHGWTGVREQRLDAYAERFAGAGLAALAFDYRHFGASSGEPRQLLDIARQLADWQAAIAFVRSRAEIDPGRVALWGTSFSGGHVIETAARDRQIAAVIAQVPFADGLRNLPSLGLALALRLIAAGLRDQLGAAVGRPPHMVASVGPPGSVAVMTTPDAEPGFAEAASAAITAGAALGAIADAERTGELRARRALSADVLRQVTRAAKRKREADSEYEQAITRAGRLGLSHREIAGAAEVSHGTVRAMLARATGSLNGNASQRGEAEPVAADGGAQ